MPKQAKEVKCIRLKPETIALIDQCEGRSFTDKLERIIADYLENELEIKKKIHALQKQEREHIKANAELFRMTKGLRKIEKLLKDIEATVNIHQLDILEHGIKSVNVLDDYINLIN